jgi:phosphocarrier protein HPr
MIEKKITLASELGLHARPSSTIVSKLQQLKLNSATMEYDGVVADLTSIMSLLTLFVRHKSTVLVKIDGADEEKAVAIIEEIFALKEKLK